MHSTVSEHFCLRTSSAPGGLQVEDLARFHSGAIVSLATCPSAHFAVTAGSDGSVRLYDYRGQEGLKYHRTFNSPATCMMLLPPSVDPSQRVVLVGFADGVLRAVMRHATDWSLVAVFKPHKKAMTSMSISPDGRLLATASGDGTVFFFHVVKPTELEPVAFTVVQVSSCVSQCNGPAFPQEV